MTCLRALPGLPVLSALALPLLLAGCSGDDVGRDSETTTLPTTATQGTVTTSGTSAGTSDGTDTTTSAGTDSDGETTSSTSTTAGTDATSSDPTSDSDTDSGSATDTDGTTGGFCTQGEIVCEDGVAKVCDGMGGWESEEACDNACADGLGCVLCVPDSHQCEGDVSQKCTPQGDGWVDNETCDPVQGVMCDQDSGQCLGPCASGNIGLSYIGCDYYPTVTQQLDFYTQGTQYAVAVANTADQPATITITMGANNVASDTVAAGDVKVIPLPWTELSQGTGPSKVVIDGSYRLRSTRPVTVYQYNPLAANVTNDASLMLPVNAWRGDYVVAAWPHWSSYPGFYSITAAQDGTTVTVQAPGGGKPTQGGGGVDSQGNGQVMLNEGDVLQVVTANGGDLTGTMVSADKPIQVLGGHDCTQVPIGITACDHLEESMFPIEALATEYIVVPPVQVPNDALEKAQVVRIIAADDNTTLTFDPDQPVNKSLANAGDFVEIVSTTAKFKVSADKKILVAQYMVGQSAGYGTSDPAMLVAVATEQYRTDYLFHAPTGWSANYVDIIAPDGASVQVDGNPVNTFAAIGATGFSVAHVKLSNAGNGNHTVSADQKVGISVYGVLNYGSYWYPGGLDLKLVPL
ncbi:MAG: IgGFc-binding protein [Myxococcales bacterium]|nr:IgGFc-binding protein [Myxococcales bacterium]